MKNSVLFLNGEFWGMYIIQEKIDNNFISRNYLIPKDNVVIAKSNFIEDGPIEYFSEFQQFCRNYSQKDLSNKEIYEEIKNKIDIDSLIELFAANLYILNFDWPARNDGEWKNFGEPIEGNKFSDGKWRFIIFDLDYTMGAQYFGVGSPDVDNFKSLQDRSKLKQAPVNLIQGLLINNTDFKYKFVNIYCDYYNDIYNIDKVNKLLEEYKKEYTEIAAYSLLRWCEKNYDSILEGYSFYKLNFTKGLNSVHNFFEQRPKFTFQHMKEFLGLKGDLVELTIEVKEEGEGQIQINSIIPKIINGKWTGKYFSKIPLNIRAISSQGYKFKEWSGIVHSDKDNI